VPRLRQFLKKAKASISGVKSVLRKILRLFQAHDRLVVIDKSVPEIRVLYIRKRKFIESIAACRVQMIWAEWWSVLAVS
jgi:hypothetical protein